MPGHGRYVGAPSPVPDLRACGVLRRFEEQARHEALPLDPASDSDLARTRRGLELVLRRRARHRARMKWRSRAHYPRETLRTPDRRASARISSIRLRREIVLHVAEYLDRRCSPVRVGAGAPPTIRP